MRLRNACYVLLHVSVKAERIELRVAVACGRFLGTARILYMKKMPMPTTKASLKMAVYLRRGAQPAGARARAAVHPAIQPVQRQSFFLLQSQPQLPLPCL